MKLPVSKSTAVFGGGLLLVAGIIAVLQLTGGDGEIQRESRGRGESGERGERAWGRHAAAKGASSAARDAAAQPCPNDATVEDPALKVDPDFVKSRFAAKICSQTSNGEINACVDPDEETCKARIGKMNRVAARTTQCRPRGAELHCTVYALANNKPVTACFETKASCDDYRAKQQGRNRICRTSPACEVAALPPL